MTFDQVVNLASEPARRRRLPPERFAEAVVAGCLAFGLDDERCGHEVTRGLYDEAVKRLPAERRKFMAGELARALEKIGRASGRAPAGALRPALLLDTDSGVVATAALELAQVATPIDDDPLTGCRLVLELALDENDHERQGAMLAGLAALSDARVFDFLEFAWDAIPDDSCVHALWVTGANLPTIASIGFVLGRAEHAAQHGREGVFGAAIGTLVRLARSLDGRGSPAAALPGVADIERAFPSWAAGEESGPIAIRRTLPLAVVRAQVCRRLNALAETEREPLIVPLALAAWTSEFRQKAPTQGSADWSRRKVPA
jgi:hypothetical protein